MFFQDTIKHKTVFRLSLVTLPLIFVVIVLGAFTRLVDAGLGCPDWPGCYGHLLWPNEAHEVIQAEAKFPDTPVETDKTWPEMVHRYFAGSLGFFILLIMLMCIRLSKQDPKAPVKLSVALLMMVILQGAFGMWTVTLKLWPQVVTAHLLGGFATLSLLWLLLQRLGAKPWTLNQGQALKLQRIKPWLWLALGVVIAQIALGGWVSSNYAALACPDVPLCFGQWLPPSDFSAGFNIFQDIGPNYLGGQLDNHARTAIHLSHRIGAVVVAVVLLVVGALLLALHDQLVRQWVLLLWAVLLLQISLGLSNIVFALPLWVAVAHNAVAAALLLVLLGVIYRTVLVCSESAECVTEATAN